MLHRYIILLLPLLVTALALPMAGNPKSGWFYRYSPPSPTYVLIFE